MRGKKASQAWNRAQWRERQTPAVFDPGAPAPLLDRFILWIARHACLLVALLAAGIGYALGKI